MAAGRNVGARGSEAEVQFDTVRARDDAGVEGRHKHLGSAQARRVREGDGDEDAGGVKRQIPPIGATGFGDDGRRARRGVRAGSPREVRRVRE